MLKGDSPPRFTICGDGCGGRVELVCGDPAIVVPPTHIGISVPWGHLDSLIAQLKARGATLDEPYAPVSGLMWINTFDPGGNWLQFVSREVGLDR